jgi:uncharacterized integral membrane protein
MWFVKALFTIVVLAGILVELMWNYETHVDVFLTSRNVPNFTQVPLAIVMLGAFVLGVLFWFVVSFFQVVSAKSEVSALKRKNRQLARELTDLRNMPVKDLDPESLPARPVEDEAADG